MIMVKGFARRRLIITAGFIFVIALALCGAIPSINAASYTVTVNAARKKAGLLRHAHGRPRIAGRAQHLPEHKQRQQSTDHHDQGRFRQLLPVDRQRQHHRLYGGCESIGPFGQRFGDPVGI
jgi:hypothetical protein